VGCIAILGWKLLEFRVIRLDVIILSKWFMRVKMNIALRKRTLSPVRLVLEDSSKRSFVLFVGVSLQSRSIFQSNNLSKCKETSTDSQIA
jgi:hypothetical protein